MKSRLIGMVGLICCVLLYGCAVKNRLVPIVQQESGPGIRFAFYQEMPLLNSYIIKATNNSKGILCFYPLKEYYFITLDNAEKYYLDLQWLQEAAYVDGNQGRVCVAPGETCKIRFGINGELMEAGKTIEITGYLEVMKKEGKALYALEYEQPITAKINVGNREIAVNEGEKEMCNLPKHHISEYFADNLEPNYRLISPK